MTDLIQLQSELFQDCMPVLVTSKFDEDPIKNESATLKTPVSHYKSIFMCFFRHYRTPYSKRGGPIWPKLKFVETVCLSSLLQSLTKIGSKLKGLDCRNCSPHYQSIGAFYSRGMSTKYRELPQHPGVCHSVCIFWTNYCIVEPHCSNFSIITAIFQVSEYLGTLQQCVLSVINTL